MTTYRGAEYHLQSQVRTHLFLLCPNNSGSTFLNRAIARSQHVWSLPREGQHVLGFAGPNTAGKSYALLWASDPDVLAMFQDGENYDWVKTRKAWYFQATATTPTASVFLTKAPPFLMIPDQLDAAFPDTKFIVMVRNPYAVAEGILRRRADPEQSSRRADVGTRAAQHIVACMRQQQRNTVEFGAKALVLTYEEFCREPEATARRLQALVPTLDDLDLVSAVPVKGTYNERLRNMNEDQIARLSVADIENLNTVFVENRHYLEYFGYSVIEPIGAGAQE